MRLFPLSGLLASALSSACLAGPVISEFLASNDSGEQDEDGDHSDWIEIHNPELAPIELDGWALTEYQLIGVASRLSDKLLNDEGVNRD